MHMEPRTIDVYKFGRTFQVMALHGIRTLSPKLIRGTEGTKGSNTDASIELVAIHCRELKFMNVAGTGKEVTKKSLSMLTTSCSKWTGVVEFESADQISPSILLILGDSPFQLGSFLGNRP